MLGRTKVEVSGLKKKVGHIWSWAYNLEILGCFLCLLDDHHLFRYYVFLLTDDSESELPLTLARKIFMFK